MIQGAVLTTLFFFRQGVLARAALAFTASVIAACSGAVSAPPSSNTGPISLSPSSATLYSSLPTEFLVTGGTGQYFITSSDQSVVPVVGQLQGNTFTLVPGPV